MNGGGQDRASTNRTVGAIGISERPASGARDPPNPGPISVPKNTLQTLGTLQVPRGLQAVKESAEKCAQRLSVVADALFAFNKSTLAPQAEETLIALLPLIAQAGKHPMSVEGHTDSIGSATYNQRLSESRAKSLKAWLVTRKAIDAATPSKGFGKTKPVAPNTKADGSDDPEGRQKNRRVELVINTCSWHPQYVLGGLFPVHRPMPRFRGKVEEPVGRRVGPHPLIATTPPGQRGTILREVHG